MKKQIVVRTNDPVHEKINLEVTGFVEEVAKVEPNSVNFVGKPGDEFEQVVSITPSEKYNFKIQEISLKTDMYLTAELKMPQEGQNTWQIVIKNIMTTPGRYFDIITVRTDSKIKPEIKIRVYGMLSDEPAS